MRKNKVLWIFMVMILALPLVQADISDSIGNVGNSLFQFFLNDYVVFIFTLIFFIILFYGIFAAALSRIPSIGESEHVKKIAVALSLVSSLALFWGLAQQGIKVTLTTLLTPIGFFGGLALAFVVFGFFFYTMEDSGGNRNWQMAFIAAGIALIFWGMFTESKDAMAWGWVLLIIGLIAGATRLTGAGAALANRFGGRGGRDGGAGGAGAGGGAPAEPDEEAAPGDPEEGDGTISGRLIDSSASDEGAAGNQDGAYLNNPGNMPPVYSLLNGDPANLRIWVGGSGSRGGPWIRGTDWIRRSANRIRRFRNIPGIRGRMLNIPDANKTINPDGTFEITNVPRLAKLTIYYIEEGQRYRHIDTPWGRGGQAQPDNPPNGQPINLTQNQNEVNVVVGVARGRINGRIIDVENSNTPWEQGPPRATGQQIYQQPAPQVTPLPGAVNVADIRVFRGAEEIVIPDQHKIYYPADAPPIRAGSFTLFGLPFGNNYVVHYINGGVDNSNTDGNWGRGGQDNANPPPPQGIVLAPNRLEENFTIIGVGNRIVRGRVVDGGAGPNWAGRAGVNVEIVDPGTGATLPAAASDANGLFEIDITAWGWDDLGPNVEVRDVADNTHSTTDVANGGHMPHPPPPFPAPPPTGFILAGAGLGSHAPAVLNTANEIRIPIPPALTPYVQRSNPSWHHSISATAGAGIFNFNPINIGRTGGPGGGAPPVNANIKLTWVPVSNISQAGLDSLFTQHCSSANVGFITLAGTNLGPGNGGTADHQFVIPLTPNPTNNTPAPAGSLNLSFSFLNLTAPLGFWAQAYNGMGSPFQPIQFQITITISPIPGDVQFPPFAQNVDVMILP